MACDTPFEHRTSIPRTQTVTNTVALTDPAAVATVTRNSMQHMQSRTQGSCSLNTRRYTPANLLTNDPCWKERQKRRMALNDKISSLKISNAPDNAISTCAIRAESTVTQDSQHINGMRHQVTMDQTVVSDPLSQIRQDDVSDTVDISHLIEPTIQSTGTMVSCPMADSKPKDTPADASTSTDAHNECIPSAGTKVIWLDEVESAADVVAEPQTGSVDAASVVSCPLPDNDTPPDADASISTDAQKDCGSAGTKEIWLDEAECVITTDIEKEAITVTEPDTNNPDILDANGLMNAIKDALKTKEAPESISKLKERFDNGEFSLEKDREQMYNVRKRLRDFKLIPESNYGKYSKMTPEEKKKAEFKVRQAWKSRKMRQ
jgi:hypothetical protein